MPGQPDNTIRLMRNTIGVEDADDLIAAFRRVLDAIRLRDQVLS
ncbi:MAG: hypothetical protein P0Y59_17335 [Candidatus Sphingomonas phytovorans]|nr:hypothetical protein [Sphingomonas sp.]WEJ98693.1 MAG: hypothetical protein P0Y59_17335 [Sphingomonas sp.]